MSKTIKVTELLRNFSDYIARVTYKGESFILHKGKLKVAELKPVPIGCTLRELRDSLKKIPLLDKSESLEFRKDLKASKKKEKPVNPWE